MSDPADISDHDLVEDFRQLFDLTPEDLARVTGISMSTWEDLDQHRTSRGLCNALAMIREIMALLYPVPFGDLRRWLTRGGARSPRNIVRRPGGLFQTLQILRSQGDGVT